MKYLPALDGLRAIAVLAVLAYHAGLPVPAGFVGVDVFFVISGYLITGLLASEYRDTGRIDFMAFYARRVRRILPAMVVVVLAVLAASTALLSPLQRAGVIRSAVASAGMVGNVFFKDATGDYFSPNADEMPLLHLWSLSVEEQFYFFWPLLLIVMLRNRRESVWIGLLALASMAAAEIWLHTTPEAAFYLMPARFWELAIGGWIALRPSNPKPWEAYTGLALLAVAIAVPMPAFPGLGALPAVLGAALVIHALHGGADMPLLRSRPMVFVGLISYSLYLWHWPLLALDRAIRSDPSPLPVRLALCVAAFVLAWLSYRYVEAPARRWRVSSRRMIFSGLGALAVVFAAGFGLQRGLEDDATALPEIYAMGCDVRYRDAAVKPCTFGPQDAPHTAVLMGDSVAMQWYPAVSEIFDRSGWKLVVLTKGSCPMVNAPWFYPRIKREYKECAQWRAAALKAVAAMRPDVVILGSTYTYGFTQAQWTDGTASVLRTLSPTVGAVRVLRATPTELATQDGDAVYQWQRAAAAGLGNVGFVDMNDLVCPSGQCAPTTFRDKLHLRVSIAESMSEPMESRLLLH